MNRKGGLAIIIVYIFMWVVWFIGWSAFDLFHYTGITVFDNMYETLNRSASTDAQTFINDYGTVKSTVNDGKQLVFFAYTMMLFVFGVAIAYYERGQSIGR